MTGVADPVPVRRRWSDPITSRWPAGAAGRVLLALVVLGVLLRLLALISLWPTTILEDNYQIYAKTNPFLDPLHPAGYSLILGAIGFVTHRIYVVVVLQHIVGICAALLLYAATRRVTGSAWAGLLPAGIVLLGGDEIFLEHSIMSETWLVLAVSIGLYGAVRALDEPAPWTRWPLLTGVALGIAVTIREASALLIAIPVIALLIAGRRGWRLRWRAPVAVAATAAIVLLAYATASAAFGVRFGVASSPGWFLYGRVAQFANCKRFTPPAGTAALCQTIPPSRRPSGYYYMYTPYSPAVRKFGAMPHDDGLVGAWAERALRAQFGDYLAMGWSYLRSYYVPGSLPARLKGSSGLDPELSFTYTGTLFAPFQVAALRVFFDPFTIHRRHWALELLRHWQLVIRFGGTALFVTTVLTLVGLLIGTRRSRVGVLLFGIGGFVLLVVPAFTSTYAGRYTVPVDGPMMAAAAITITELVRLVARRRSVSSRGRLRSALGDAR